MIVYLFIVGHHQEQPDIADFCWLKLFESVCLNTDRNPAGFQIGFVRRSFSSQPLPIVSELNPHRKPPTFSKPSKDSRPGNRATQGRPNPSQQRPFCPESHEPKCPLPLHCYVRSHREFRAQSIRRPCRKSLPDRDLSEKDHQHLHQIPSDCRGSEIRNHSGGRRIDQSSQGSEKNSRMRAPGARGSPKSPRGASGIRSISR